VQDVVNFAIQTGEALEEAHRKGIIHRDIKTDNIMVNARNQVKVMDFGLAKQLDSDTKFTRTGTTIGTPAYMPPEQASGESGRVDHRADIYSLGAVLYELLTGKPPFSGDTMMNTLIKVLNDEPVPLKRLNPRVHRDIQTIVLKAMEKTPERRYPTMRSFADDVRRFIAGESISARPAGPLGRAWRWYRNHPEAAVWTAGGYAACSSIFLLCWNLAGIVVLSLGIHRSEDVGSAMALLGAIAVGVYLPILWAGLQTLRGGLIGLCVNALLAMIGVAFCVLGLAGHMFADEAIWGNRMTRLPLFTLLIAIALVGLVLHVIALVSRRAEKS